MVSLGRFLLSLLLLLGLTAPSLADPRVPPLTGRVVDLAGVLDARTLEALTTRLADYEAATTNQVVVVTLPDLRGDTIERWGYVLLNGWGIGQRGKNNGVVLVLAPNDRRLRIEVGYGLEYALTEAASARIIENEIVPRLRRGDLAGGVNAGVDAIIETIAGTYQPPLVESPSGSFGENRSGLWRFAPFAIFPLFFILAVLMRISRRRNGAVRRYDGGPAYGDSWHEPARDRDGWGSRIGSGSSTLSGGRSSSGFSGGGGRSGGGGASGRW